METVTNIYGGIDNRPAAGRSTTTEMVTTRQAQEVQAAMVIAKKFPRDEVESYNRIMRACKRQSLAEQAMYEYPRGGTKVTGPSIRLAEAMAQNWGNLDYGIIELEQKNGESQVMAYAWDLETNTRQTKIFSVPHIRGTKKGNVQLTDPRDIYELVANQGARRVRACILGVIPGDVIDSAITQCNATLAGQCTGPLIDTVRQIAGTFSEKYGVTVQMLEKYIGCKIESFTMNDLIRLKKVYRSLEDGMARREDYFEMVPAANDEEIKDPFKGKKEKKQTGQAKEPEEKNNDQQGIDPSFIPPEDRQTTIFK
ncbi:hypothetical protein [Lacrimispora sp. 210928-DFI.3.58]|uniref:hypothetical protein n=1 Tax=Lacrimispora sp. 210928-DFI.3.58 TaxID=2883214 RepID=UPI001D074670|nr:hypothetical protein [Lacrimispora sp. 210928-DFI.3.58]MCB7320802.1 hypothetical protein [Lacrimispora sp. 210928-DFI.3.58]